MHALRGALQRAQDEVRVRVWVRVRGWVRVDLVPNSNPNRSPNPNPDPNPTLTRRGKRMSGMDSASLRSLTRRLGLGARVGLGVGVGAGLGLGLGLGLGVELAALAHEK